MMKQYYVTTRRPFKAGIPVLLSLLIQGMVNNALCGPQDVNEQDLKKMPSPRREIDLEKIPFKILYETYRHTDGKLNWELFQMNADGSNKINLTQTPDLDEMYPHASPDGTKICFVVDEGVGRDKIRSVYYMNIDGTERVKVATNARQPCWNPDGSKIAYLRGEYERYSQREYATSELVMYDLQSKEYKSHPNTSLHHIYAICCSPDGNWFFAAVHGNREFSDTILAIEAHGTGVFDMEKWGVMGCRPDLSRDGKKITWGQTDWDLCMGDIDFSGPEPRISNVHKIVRCLQAAKVYHVDFSPDGKYIAFSFGPFTGGQQVGGKAKGWNICVTDLSGKWVKVTTDGNHNKEPDWVPIPSTTNE
jgi:Tol biopolymer transport system component